MTIPWVSDRALPSGRRWRTLLISGTPIDHVGSHRVSRLLVEFLGMAKDIGSIDALGPFLRFDFFHGYRHRLFAVVQNTHHVSGDCFCQTLLLLLGFSRPQLHCSSLIFSIPSTFLPSTSS